MSKAATKMNAKEAKIAADKRAEELRLQREDRERQANLKAAKEWREERANWEKNHLAWIEGDIAEAVNKGQTKVSVHLETREKREDAEEVVFWKSCPFAPELKRIIAHFKNLDYKLEFSVKEYRNIDLSDLSPRDDWYTYKTMLDISW